MKKILLALLAVMFVVSGAMAATITPGMTDTVRLTSADPILIYNSGTDYEFEGTVLLDDEFQENFFFDMGNVSASPASTQKGKLTVEGGIRSTLPVNHTVKHKVSEFGPGILALGTSGYWQGTTTIAFNYLSGDMTSNDGYIQLAVDNGLPTWNPVVLQVPGENVYYRSVLDINGYLQRIRDLDNRYGTGNTAKHYNSPWYREGVINLEGARASKKSVVDLLIASVDYTAWAGDTKNWIQGTAGVLELQSSKNGDVDKANNLGRITGYGEVRLYNVLDSNAPTVYDIVSKEPGTGPRWLNAEDTKGVSMDNSFWGKGLGLGLVGFQFGDGTTLGNQVTLRINDTLDTISTDVRVRYIQGGYASVNDYDNPQKLDISKIQYTTTTNSLPDHFIVDTDGDYSYFGHFAYPPIAGNIYSNAGASEPNFVKTGYGMQRVTQKALIDGAVFKVDEVVSKDGFRKGRDLVDNVYPDGELQFFLEKDVDFSIISTLGQRPVFLSGSGWFGFNTSMDRTANVDMLMLTPTSTVKWPSISTTYKVDYNSLIPFDNNNVHVYSGTLKNAVFTSADANAAAYDPYPINVLGVATPPANVVLDPELQLIARANASDGWTNANNAFKFLPIHKLAGNLQIDQTGTVILAPWSWSAVGNLIGNGTLVMDAPKTMTAGYSNPSLTFLNVQRSSTLDVTAKDQYHRATMWLGVNVGSGAGWTVRYFVLGPNFTSNINKIVVTRGAALTVSDYRQAELDSSVAFYGTNISIEEPATYRINVLASDKTAGDYNDLSTSSVLAVKDGNQFTFADPIDLGNSVEGSVKLEFNGSARAGNVFLVLRGQNASLGERRFVYDTVNWELFSIPAELGRNLYARAKNDMLAPEVTGVGQVGKFSWSLLEVNQNKVNLGVITEPKTGILAYRYEGDPLPDGVYFGGSVNGVTQTAVAVPAGYFRFTNNLVTPFTGTVAAENIYGWSAAKTVEFTTSTPTPVTPTDPNMMVVSGDISAGYKTGDAVSVTYVFDAKYDLTTLEIVTLPSGWTYTTDAATNSVTITGTMPTGDVSFYFKALDTTTGTTYRSNTVTITNSDTPTPTPDDDGGSGGCDAGFAGLALLLAAPLFLRKKD